MRTALEIQEAAYAAFDAWLAAQSDDVQELSLLDQIEVYAKAMTDRSQSPSSGE